MAVPGVAMQQQPLAKPASAADDEEEELGAQTDVFANYRCGSINFGKDHPGDIAEANGLALVPLPEPTFPLEDSIPAEIIASGKLSILQLEGVLYACQRHQNFLPDGTRAGFFLGDGAGVGKGRQISGIILNSWARGQKQHVWMSTSNDLRLDAERDLRDLGVHVKVIDGCQELSSEGSRAFGLSKDFKEGVLFSTYSTLIGAGKRQSRLDQIVEWCGGEGFSGVLVFDEAHKAKNFQTGDNADASTKTSKCVIDIQRKMPKARVVYCSATGVTELSNLAYCERLGLWGKGLPFATFDKFFSSVSKRGVFFLEMLAMELKRQGSYVSRGLSFASAEFETVSHSLTREQSEIYDQAALLWQRIFVALEEARQVTKASKRLMSMYWGAHQRFFKQLIISFKVDFVAAETRRYVEEEGLAVVIGLQGTGEAALNRYLERTGGGTGEWMSNTLETVSGFLENNFPTRIEKEEVRHPQDPLDMQGVASMQPGVGSVCDDCVKAMRQLIAEASEINLPLSALDTLIDKLGGEKKVAEMTGRTSRLVRASNGEIKVQQRGKAEDEVDQINVKECARFNSGDRLIAIISDAASTGISLHANRTSQNLRRRVHMTLELPWSADKAVQQLGRSHRSNQVSAPMYKLVISDLAGEMRFASAVAKRLQSLGALTKGDRRAAVGQDMSEYDVETPYGRMALRKMFEGIDSSVSAAQGANVAELVSMMQGHAGFAAHLGSSDALVALNTELHNGLAQIGFTTPRKDDEASNVKKFLGRLLGLPCRVQNTLFHYFFSVMTHEVATAKKEGRYSDAITDLFGAEGCTKKIVTTEVVHTNNITGAVCNLDSIEVDRGMRWDAALKRYKANASPQEAIDTDGDKGEDREDEEDDGEERGGKEAGADKYSGFWESKREVPGRKSKGLLLAVRRNGDVRSYIVARPNVGISRTEMDVGELLDKYRRKSVEEAQPLWSKMYEDSLGWDRGERVIDVHILSGSLVPLWQTIQDTVRRCVQVGKAGLTARDMEMKVVRVEAEGKTLVGLKLPLEAMQEIKAGLKGLAELASGNAIKLWPPALSQQETLDLIARRHVSGSIRGEYRGEEVMVDCCTAWSPERAAYLLTVKTPRGAVTFSAKTLGSGINLSLGASGDSEAGDEDRVVVEPVDPVDAAALNKALTPPKTIMSFFTKAQPGTAPSNSSISSMGGGSLTGAGNKRCAGDVHTPASAGKKLKSSSPATKAKGRAGGLGVAAQGGNSLLTMFGSQAKETAKEAGQAKVQAGGSVNEAKAHIVVHQAGDGDTVDLTDD